ncbi:MULTISPECIES: ATP-binding protein [unclassified Streptomyces]|uniref:ATP-binding protein n=1 Tax=unclassified Streptomyces TaxID=2593676 RepID=UPI002E23D43D|nr:ATP-binding protein [Streptomyces sp. NBC_01023]
MNSTKTTGTAAPPTLAIEGDSPGGIPRARDAARAFAENLDPSLDTEMADTLALVVSELATNALRHGGGRYTLRLTVTPEAVCLAVSDPSPTPPRERTPDLNGGTGGFGWHMIRRLTDSVTTTPGPGQGKTMHARLTRRLPTRTAPSPHR